MKPSVSPDADWHRIRHCPPLRPRRLGGREKTPIHVGGEGKVVMSEDQVISAPCGVSSGPLKLIVGTALAFAIAALDGVRGNEAAASDRNDMVALFLHNFPDETHREMLMANVERVLGHAPDMTDWRSVASEEP
jgi:hypothetical protein